MIKNISLIILILVLLGIFVDCNGGDDNSLPPTTFRFSGKLSTRNAGDPVTNTPVSLQAINIMNGEDDSFIDIGSDRSGADGSFEFRNLEFGKYRLIVERLIDNSRLLYTIEVSPGIEIVEVEFFTELIAARETPDEDEVIVTPTETTPAGTATITNLQDGDAIECAPPPDDCRFLVEGVASPELAEPGTPFRLFVGVIPLGGNVFPQFPPVSIDPTTGEWQTDAQIGSMVAQAQPGDRFEILTFVTNAELEPGSNFPRPVDIPEVTYISEFIQLIVGPRLTRVLLIGPGDPSGSLCVPLSVIFEWSIENRGTSVYYCSDVLIDSGVNPFDGNVDARLQAEQLTSLQVSLGPEDYEWGVEAQVCEVSNAPQSCPCATPIRTISSEIFRFQASASCP